VKRIVLSAVVAVVAMLAVHLILTGFAHLSTGAYVSAPQIALGTAAVCVLLGRYLPLVDAVVATVAAACASATLGLALDAALQPAWIATHAPAVSNRTPLIASALILTGAWGLALGGAARPGPAMVRIGLATYALTGAVSWTAVAWLNPWFLGYGWPAAVHVLAFAVMAYALSRASAPPREAAVAAATVIVATELTAGALAFLTHGPTAVRVLVTPELLLAVCLAGGALAACAYAIGRRVRPV
jgi:hypothetical protein